MLTEAQINEFSDQGFLIVPGFVENEVVDSMKRRGQSIVDECQPKDVSVFSTKNQASKTDTYFLDSANNVSIFFEEGAFGENGALLKPKAFSINKIGHALHDLVPEFREWSRSEKVESVLKCLGYEHPTPVQSMYIFKQPKIGGEVVPHQDGTFLATEPQSVVGFWIALEDATIDNGCLWGLPKSHIHGIYKRFVRNAEGEVSFRGSMPHFNLKDFVPLEVKKGDLVLLHGANVHCSKENTSEASRHAFSVHYVEGGSNVKWEKENWLQRTSDFPFTPVY